MRNILITLICLIAITSCTKDEETVNPVVVPEPIPWTPITTATLIIDQTTMPIVTDDRQEIKRHLMTMVSKVTYTKIDGVWIIEANFSKEESRIFNKIRYEIIADGYRLKNFDMSYTFKEDLTKEDQKKVVEFINNNSRIFL